MDHCKSVSVIMNRNWSKNKELRKFSVCVNAFAGRCVVTLREWWFFFYVTRVPDYCWYCNVVRVMIGSSTFMEFSFLVKWNRISANNIHPSNKVVAEHSRFESTKKFLVRNIFFVVSVCWRWWNSIGELLFFFVFFLFAKMLFPQYKSWIVQLKTFKSSLLQVKIAIR